MIKLTELLALDTLLDRQAAINSAFKPYTTNIEVEGTELECLTILVNLSLKAGSVKDYTSKQQAISALASSNHLVNCAEQVQWAHTHNLKFPDPRVSKQTLISSLLAKPANTLSSLDYDVKYGWAANPRYYGPAKLFLTEFQWQSKSTCLALLLQNKLASCWQAAFNQLGITDAQLSTLADLIASQLPSRWLPTPLSIYSSQLRYPFEGDYLAITPVPSHAVQTRIVDLAFSKRIRHFTVNYDHPPNFGMLLGSIGGSYPFALSLPNISRNKTSFLQSKQNLNSLLFDDFVLLDQSLTENLRIIIGEAQEITKKRQRKQRISALKGLRRAIMQWLLPVMELRDELDQFADQSPVDNYDGLALQLLSTDRAKLTTLVNFINGAVHKTWLSKNRTKKFAYHPSLLATTQMQILNVLKRLSIHDSNCDDDFDAPVKLIHLKQLKLHGGNALNSPYLVGMPSLPAVWGFLHHYQLRCHELGMKDLEIDSFAIFINDHTLQKHNFKLEANDVSNKSKLSNVQIPGIVRGASYDMSFDIVIKLKSPVDRYYLDFSLMQAALPSSLSGGVLHPPSLYEDVDWLRLHSDPLALFWQLSRYPASGTWLCPSLKSFDGEDALLSILDEHTNQKLNFIGYGLLNTPEHRDGSICSKHAFAEPLIGLLECINPIDFRFKSERYFYNRAFWKMDFEDSAMLMKKA